MIYKQEILYSIIDEVQELLRLHHEELGRGKLDPDWERYAALEQSAAYVVYTARDGEVLSGYAGFYLNTHMHDKQSMCAINDVLFVRKEQRRGRNGLDFINFCETELRKRCFTLTWHAKPGTPLGAILQHTGYKIEEVVLLKEFKGD